MTYGFMTHSFLNSTEHRSMKAERKALTEKYEQEVHEMVIIGPICNCRSFRLPHELSRHEELASDHDWRIREE